MDEHSLQSFLKNRKKSYRTVDVIDYAEQLERYVTLKTKGQKNYQFSEYQFKCKQCLADVNFELDSINGLNQPRFEIPQRLTKFPWRYVRIFLRRVLKLYNYINGPQRVINNHLHSIAVSHTNALQQLLLEQQKHAETSQALIALQKEVAQLSLKLSQLERS